jgi:hypothetical protein
MGDGLHITQIEILEIVELIPVNQESESPQKILPGIFIAEQVADPSGVTDSFWKVIDVDGEKFGGDFDFWLQLSRLGKVKISFP